MVRSWWVILTRTFALAKANIIFRREKRSKYWMIQILGWVEEFVFGIILFPLGVLYMLGLYISAGVSLWRLIEHDFGNEGGANMKKSLHVLYSLAVAQGVLFGYRTIYVPFQRYKLVKLAANRLGKMDEELVAEYVQETIGGCEMDPSFAAGRNLVTYGVDLMMEAKSNEGFIAGIRVLGAAIKGDWPSGRKVLTKHLLTRSDSSSYIIRRLLETVGPRSPYSRDVRQHAARIVALVARGIRLQQFPGMIECISSVLDTSMESNQEVSVFDSERREYGGNKFKDYQRVELLERYELNYLKYECKSLDSPDFSLRNLIQRLVQCLPCKRRTMESGGQEKQRKNAVHGFDGLLTEAVNIIHQLSHDEGNRRIMSNSVLHHKIAILPLKLHRDNHDACMVSMKSELQMLEKCWVLMEWLVAVADVKENNSQGQTLKEGRGACRPPLPPAVASDGGGRRGESIEDCGACSPPLQPAATSDGGGRGSGEKIEEEKEGDEERLPEPVAPLLGRGKGTGNELKIEEEEEGEGECFLQSMVGSTLGNEIINNIKSTIKSIFDCLDCRVTQKKQGIQILLHLSLNMSFMMDGESRMRRLTWILLLIFLSQC
ncbi:unnamed protein product [Urochloa humidicola]